MRPAAAVSNPDRAYDTTGTVIGRFVSNRQGGDQHLIDRVANAFLTGQERENLMSLLSLKTKKITYSELKFDAEEAQILRTRSVLNFVQGTGTSLSNEHAGFPFLQLYDFLLTIDDVMSQIRGLEIQVVNMDNLGHGSNRDLLRQSIMHPSFRPWPFVDQLRKIGTPSNPEELIGIAIGETTVYDPKELILNKTSKDGDVKNVREKTSYEKCTEEAEILEVPLMNAICALGQGLFTVHLVNAHMFKIDTKKKAKISLMNARIPIGAWINAFASDSAYPVGEENYKQGSEVLIIPKYTNIRGYPANFHGMMHRANLNNKDELARMYNIYNTEEDFLQRSKLEPHKFRELGGAIGKRIWVLSDVKRDKDDKITSLESSPEATMDQMSGKRESGMPPQTHADKEMKDFSISWAHDVMETLRYHPIFVCPRLAKAFNQSGVSQLIVEKYMNLRKQFANKDEKTSLGLTTADPLQYMQNRSRGVSRLNAFQCGEGQVMQFRDFNGKKMTTTEAIFVGDDGQRYYSPDVSMNLSTCFDPIPVDVKRGQAEIYDGNTDSFSHGGVQGASFPKPVDGQIAEGVPLTFAPTQPPPPEAVDGQIADHFQANTIEQPETVDLSDLIARDNFMGALYGAKTESAKPGRTNWVDKKGRRVQRGGSGGLFVWVYRKNKTNNKTERVKSWLREAQKKQLRLKP